MTIRRSLEPATWPDIDRQRWAEARRVKSFLSGATPAAKWSPKRCRILEQGYGQWLCFLLRHGELDREQLPEARVTPVRIGAFVAELQARVSPWSTAMMMQGVQRMLAVIAPAEDWSWLTKAVANLKRWAKPSRDRRGHMVSPDQLYALGRSLMDQADLDANRYHAATMARDGLMIAVLACCPVRIANLTQIRIGRHLLFDSDRYRLVFGEEETKTDRKIEGELPPEMTAMVGRYLDVHRRHLLSRGSGETTTSLRIDRWGRPMHESPIRTQIEKRTRDAFGRHVWPHLFRAIAATGFADLAPDEASLIPDLLGHASTQTAHKHYVLSRGMLAHKTVQTTLLEARAEAAARFAGRKKEAS